MRVRWSQKGISPLLFRRMEEPFRSKQPTRMGPFRCKDLCQGKRDTLECLELIQAQSMLLRGSRTSKTREPSIKHSWPKMGFTKPRRLQRAVAESVGRVAVGQSQQELPVASRPIRQ